MLGKTICKLIDNLDLEQTALDIVEAKHTYRLRSSEDPIWNDNAIRIDVERKLFEYRKWQWFLTEKNRLRISAKITKAIISLFETYHWPQPGKCTLLTIREIAQKAAGEKWNTCSVAERERFVDKIRRVMYRAKEFGSLKVYKKTSVELLVDETEAMDIMERKGLG